ncbi:DUF3632 domain-containing protein [Aspergillus glaucus CBS 516.65]|uniref:Uncharacterized protein n=1 Tax=Aspergillus glaucus CBS 516.65 TaxID=1160497 RepID=A0A1L9VML3_ASPGL|nr:hypothetical protein ASPGLDRAFT_24976 [Aspergillus glaucus CBS 516.65]OJJ85124.1 hypothetical protein ASPGLDRAFT_24976 [Aspergillus glaucus CBS 516.65]
MEALRADPASPSPRHDPDPTLVAASAGDRKSVRDAIKRGEFDDLRSAAYNKTWTPSGALWNDLPFFVADMTDFWVNDCAMVKANERLSFASFLAKLASTRLGKDRLCQIALLAFREMFETERLLRVSETTDENSGRIMHDLDIAALLPVACAWIREAGYNIILLSDMSWNDCSSSIAQGGDTFVKSELGQRAPAGFNSWRLLYWLKRLHEIADEAKQAEEKHLAEQATEAIEMMLGHTEERNSKILRVFEAAGDGLRQDMAFSGLEKLVKGDESSDK